MARPKEFDRDAAIDAALQVFWSKGYEAASTDELLSAMGIGRQSMYDTFGDKQRLFFEALRRYHHENGAMAACLISEAASPLDGIRATLLALAERDAVGQARGCLGINATTSLGSALPDVKALAAATARAVEGAFEEAVRRAQAQHQLAASLDPRAAAQFLYALLQGLTVRAQAGASREALRNAAHVAMEALILMH